MLSTEQIVENLSYIGLNKYESKVYLTLVEEGISTAKNISDVTSIPYGKVYEIINSLLNKGFIETSPTKPVKCKAVDPRDVLNSSKKTYLNKFNSIQSCVEKQLLPVFLNNKSFLDSKSSCWSVNGRSNVNKKVEDLLLSAKNSITILTSTNGFKRLGLFKEQLLEAFNNDVSIKVAAPLDKECEPDKRSLNFCEIVNVTGGPGTLFVIDDHMSLLIEPVPDDDNIFYGRDLGIVISSPAFTQILSDSFMHRYSQVKI